MPTIDLPAKVAFDGIVLCWWAFILTFWLRKRSPNTQPTRRDPGSYLGLFLQSAAYCVVWFRPVRQLGVPIPSLAAPPWIAWTIAVIGIVLAAASAGLVIWSARCLGKQWSLGARLVEGHNLIEEGPYQVVRNPIYAGMYGLLIATGLAVRQWWALLIAIVIFGVGTWIRIRSEERLLRDGFKDQFDDYARRVPALIPGIY